MIPSNNLLRLRPGIVIRFAGRHWKVQKVRPFVVDLEPSRETAGLEIGYSGSKAPLDPTNLEEMLRLLESVTDFPHMAAAGRERFLQVSDRIRCYVGWDRIPVVADHTGYHYFTFAGQILNSVIARWANLGSFQAGEIVLRTASPIEFSKLPTDPTELRFIAGQAMRAPENLTLFQELLPAEMLERELSDVWVKRPIFGRSLERLSKSSLVLAPMSALAELYA